MLAFKVAVYGQFVSFEGIMTSLELSQAASRFFSRRVDQELPPIPSIVPLPDSPVTPVSPSSPTSVYTVFEEDERFAVETTVTSDASRSPKEPTGFRLLKKKSKFDRLPF